MNADGSANAQRIRARNRVGERVDPAAAIEARARTAARWTCGLLASGVIVLFAAVRLPPLYDYYHWIFQGDVLGTLLFGGASAAPLRALYSIQSFPVPNLGAPVALALLTRILAPLDAGRVLAAAIVLALAFAYGRLVRVVQGRRSALEILALPFALGYFLYKGYLSYLLSLALAFAAIALAQRIAGAARIRRGQVAALALLGCATFLAHLMGWGVLALALCMQAIAAYREGDRKRAAALVATLAPATGMLVWYVLGMLARARAAGIPAAHARIVHSMPFYDSLADKLLSLASAPALFLRLDPFPSAVPVALANLLALGLLAALVFASREPAARAASAPLGWTAAALALLAIVLPFGEVAGMNRPDERFVVPAILLAVACLRHRRDTATAWAAGGVVLTLVLAVHGVAYRSAGGEMRDALAVSQPVIAAGDKVLTLTSFRSRMAPTCDGDRGLAIGSPAPKWLGLARLRAQDAPAVDLMETSALRWAWPETRVPTLHARTVTPDELPAALADRAGLAGFDYVEVFGCPEDLAAAREAGPELTEVGSTDRYVLFRRAR